MSNDRNSKIQTMTRHGRFGSLNIGICDLFVIWCLALVILDTKLQGRVIISDPRNAGQAWPKGPGFQYKNITETT